MQPIRKRQIALVRVAQKKLGLADPAYREVLAELAGVASTKELDQDGFEVVMGYFEWRGFGPNRPRGPDYGQRPGMATPGQVALIRDLWSEYTRRAGTEADLNTWLMRTFKVSAPRFLTMDAARKAITALKAIKSRCKVAA